MVSNLLGTYGEFNCFSYVQINKCETVLDLESLGFVYSLAIHERQDEACCSWMADEQQDLYFKLLFKDIMAGWLES